MHLPFPNSDTSEAAELVMKGHMLWVNRPSIALIATLGVMSPLQAKASGGGRAEPEATQGEMDVEYEEAARLRRDAEDHFFEEDYDAAIANFEAAYKLSPHPTDLFNMGRIHEEKGELEAALRRYEEFVAQPRVSLEERGVAAERIKVLRDLVGNKGETSQSGAGGATSEEGRTVGERTTDSDRGPPTAGKPLLNSGIALMSVGAAFALAGGLGFGLVARRHSDRIEDLDEGQNPNRLSLAQAEDLQARGKDLETFQIVSISAGLGLALVGAGLMTGGLIQRRNQRLEALTPVVGPTFVGASTLWRF